MLGQRVGFSLSRSVPSVPLSASPHTDPTNLPPVQELEGHLKDIQTTVSRNLSLVAAYLDVRFEYAAPTLVIANVQMHRLTDAFLATLMLDYCGKVRFSGPVVHEAARCLYRLGYRVKFFDGEAMHHTLCGRANELSAHERLGAIAHFARARC